MKKIFITLFLLMQVNFFHAQDEGERISDCFNKIHYEFLLDNDKCEWNRYVGLLQRCQRSMKAISHTHEEILLKKHCYFFLYNIYNRLYERYYPGGKKPYDHEAPGQLLNYFTPDDYQTYIDTNIEKADPYWNLSITEFKDPKDTINKEYKNDCSKIFFSHYSEKSSWGAWNDLTYINCERFLDRMETYAKDMPSHKEKKENIYKIKKLKILLSQHEECMLINTVPSFITSLKDGD